MRVMRSPQVAGLTALSAAVSGLCALPASAEEAVPDLAQRVADLEAYMSNSKPAALTVAGPGHNAWLMTCAALVLFMTLPGLALFYGGLVRRKNILSVIAQCGAMAGLIPLLWWAFGYSMAFAPGNPFVGGFDLALLDGVGGNSGMLFWVSDIVFCMFQMMFAIITPALIVGAIAERMKFSSLLMFLLLWMVVVYFPMAHMVWGPGGFMNGIGNPDAGIKAIDFAGGTVVHMTSGWSALILCMMLGPRAGFGKKPMAPHSLAFTAIGTGMLWVGWYGFNAGSAGAADAVAANAFATTTLAAAVAGATWPAIEWLNHGKPTVLGFCSGVVAGLVVITPAAGFVTPSASVAMGAIAGTACFFACTKLKAALKYDDALDTFGVHGVGGTLGAVLTGVFATPSVNGAIEPLMNGLLLEQLKSIGFTLLISVVSTVVLASVVKAVMGLRASQEVEEAGLDYNDHGESGYTDGVGGHVEIPAAAVAELALTATTSPATSV